MLPVLGVNSSEPRRGDLTLPGPQPGPEFLPMLPFPWSMRGWGLRTGENLAGGLTQSGLT